MKVARRVSQLGVQVWKRDRDLNLIKVHVEQVLVGNEEKSKVERQEERKGYCIKETYFQLGVNPRSSVGYRKK